jgi:hypothetical protein
MECVTDYLFMYYACYRIKSVPCAGKEKLVANRYLEKHLFPRKLTPIDTRLFFFRTSPSF